MLRKQLIILLISLALAVPAWADINDDLIDSLSVGDTLTADGLVKRGADLNAENEDGETPLIVAAANNFPGAINFSLNRTADINRQNRAGFTALMAATMYGAVKSVRLLTSSYWDPKVDINIKNNAGKTALMYAAAYGDTEVMGLLLFKDADNNAKSNIGKTALIYAVEKGHLKATEELFKWPFKGEPDLTAKTNNGKTALDIANAKNNNEILKFLTEKVDSQFSSAAINGEVEKMKVLLSMGADIKSNSIFGFTALMFAARNGQIAAVQFLLDNGANINTSNFSGKTALALAIANNHTEIIKILQAAGAK